MAFEFRLPDVGEGLHEAEIVDWKVKAGDAVVEDQPLVEIQTDKAAVELTSPVAGRVVSITGEPGEILAVGTVIAVFETVADTQTAAAPPPAAAAAPISSPAAVAAPEETPMPPARAAGDFGDRRALATPAVRRIARELGIDINRVPGSGAKGRVTAADVRRFATGSAVAAEAATPASTETKSPSPAVASAPAATGGQRIPLRGTRRAIAAAMTRSKQTAPHVTVVDEADLTELVALRAGAREIAERKGTKLTYLPFIIKALTIALKEFPYLNSRLDDEAQEIVLHAEYNIGIATDTENGLIVPVIKNADQKSILQLATEISDLSAKARAGKISLDELRGGTFSISNQGSVGGLFFTPIINWPETAILGVSKIQERPVAVEGRVVIREMSYLVVSFDHRVIDGAMATRFLTRLAGLLSNPTLLLMELI